MAHSMLGRSLAALMFLAIASSADGRTLYVASNGVDAPGCGPKASPCRSISQAVNTNAADGDAIVVGPGTYGDLNDNGTLGDSPGEETGGFGCVLLVGRAVTLTSSDGAAATIIDGRSDSTSCNVGIVVDGTQFGKPGKGFTVTNPQGGGNGVVINATNVAVRGNQVLALPDPLHAYFPGIGIQALNAPQTILIEANQVIGWDTGILASGAGKTVRKNLVAMSGNSGISASSGSAIVGNIVAGGSFGIAASGTVSVVGNAAYGNGIGLSGGGGIIVKNNFYGNSKGLENRTGGALLAADNYWGAATGPGPDPADTAVDGPNSGPTTVTPFATKPFKVKVPIKP